MALDEEIDVSELAEGPRVATHLIARSVPGRVRRFRVNVVSGPSLGKSVDSVGDRVAIGSHPSNDLVLDDPTVSRFHCEIVTSARGPWLRDLSSSNGTSLDGVSLGEGGLREGSLIQVGTSTLSFQLGTESNVLAVSEATRMGTLVGKSIPMRAVFALLEKAAVRDATVLIEGETGTGKEGAAESIHRTGARAQKPFLVVDCSALPATLLESELFGHERGAFTGATSRRVGVFEEAEGGTVFLDEIGELPPDLQPKLLRVLERREIRRVGQNQYKSVNVRLIAATHRDLRASVNRDEFRADLYFRLAVVKLTMPPLRARLDDIPMLVEHFISALGLDEATAANLRDASFQARLAESAWPGNVRELRNHLERCVVLREALPVEGADTARSAFQIDPRRSYGESKRDVLSDFERIYLESLLALHGGNVSKAARAAGMDRVHLHKLLHRHRLR